MYTWASGEVTTLTGQSSWTQCTDGTYSAADHQSWISCSAGNIAI